MAAAASCGRAVNTGAVSQRAPAHPNRAPQVQGIMGNRRMQRWVDSSSGGSSGGGRQRASALVAAAAASAEQQQQQQQQQRATRASFEQYILDLQRRIIEASVA